MASTIKTVLRWFTGGSQHVLNTSLDAISGAVVPNLSTDGAAIFLDYQTSIGIGSYGTGHKAFRGFGRRSSLTTATNGNDIWQGAAIKIPFPNQTTGQQMSLVSTSASDASAGSGARTVDVHYLDNLGAEQHEIVTMNGLTPV